MARKTGQVVRITPVPRSSHQNSGLQAIYFAQRYGDVVWAVPGPGRYVGAYDNVKFFFLDRDLAKRIFPIRAIRILFLLWLFCVTPFSRARLFFVHSFVFAIPLFVLRKRYCMFFHGTDRRFLSRGWAQRITGGAIAAFGVGFSQRSGVADVQEVPNIFVPAAPPDEPSIDHDMLFVLRNAPVKNPFYPIALCDRLGGTLSLRIVVAGVGPEELPAEEQKKLVQLQNAGQQIQYLGRLPYEAVTRLMAGSRIIMMPSFSEGVPKAILEGMSQGLHVIINKALQFPKDILDRVEAIELDNWDAMEETIRRLREKSRNVGNMEFAQRYLERSQESLFKTYDMIYEKH